MPEPKPGDIFAGRFRIEQLLGAGGYGRVYRATQLTLGRSVALKTISTIYEDGAARFAREASFFQRLEHPNTVRLYDFGTTDQGQPYLVLELLRGQSLEDLVDKGGALPLETALRVTSQVLKSLMEAHGLGIIHRDIKPGNVFITSHPGEPMFVKVLDFGLAKDLSNSASRTAGGTQVGSAALPALTRAGEVMGTATYMAPEQVTGGALSPRSDLYAVGLVLAEMLLGTALVQGKSPMAVAMTHASPHPLPLPPQLVASRAGPIIARALAKRPEQRYATAAEMLADVERALAPPPAKPRGVQLSPRLIIGLAATIGFLLVVSIVGIALATRWRGESKKAREHEKSVRDERDDDDTSSAKGARTARSSPASSSAAFPKAPRQVISFDMSEIKTKLGQSGYTVVNELPIGAGTVRETILTVRNTFCMGSVTVIEYADDAVAKQSSGAIRSRTFLEGKKLLSIDMQEYTTAKETAACDDPVVQLLTRPL